MVTKFACRNMNIPLLSVFPGEVRVHSVDPYKKRLLFALPCADIRMVPNWERITLRMYMSPCLLNFHAEYIMQNARLDEAQAGIKIVRRNINNLRYADDINLRQKAKN